MIRKNTIFLLLLMILLPRLCFSFSEQRSSQLAQEIMSFFNINSFQLITKGKVFSFDTHVWQFSLSSNFSALEQQLEKQPYFRDIQIIANHILLHGKYKNNFILLQLNLKPSTDEINGILSILPKVDRVDLSTYLFPKQLRLTIFDEFKVLSHYQHSAGSTQIILFHESSKDTLKQKIDEALKKESWQESFGSGFLEEFWQHQNLKLAINYSEFQQGTAIYLFISEL